jgi:hypothetical protein
MSKVLIISNEDDHTTNLVIDWLPPLPRESLAWSANFSVWQPVSGFTQTAYVARLDKIRMNE